ncbi:MAG: nucleotidyl transferase AbiEii/AbiGii toxin family protein [Ectothiorhodospiraceae bacterium AqS1]|nr:nucleotidyl transferase AbiEii/AbiGii toxin family protein [Ectothiorhodospiraceae bacterium AqS1]
MTTHDNYRAQVELLIRCLPAVAEVPDFALKGGTAINLFLLNMPRLSVDIDLTYLPISSREEALRGIHTRLTNIAETIEGDIPNVDVRILKKDIMPKLYVRKQGVTVKVEPNAIVRGSLLPPVTSELCPAAQEAYDTFTEIQQLDTSEVYAGKICAALDRQHPRDLFDIMLLQAAGPIPDMTRQAFVAYLAGNRRPIANTLQPKRQPIEEAFTSQLIGMTEMPVDLASLEDARTQLFEWVANALSENERRFLLSIKQGEPDWSLLPFKGLDRWPAIQWKLLNIRKMDNHRHKTALNRLREVLQI